MWDRFVTGQRAFATTALLTVLCLTCATHVNADQPTPLSQVTAPPDAVIDLWQQSWTLNDNGSATYHFKQHVRLNNDRSYDEFADPRITYNTETDQLDVIVARVKIPDGSYKQLADYSHVLVSPDGPAGWPEFSTIRQHLLVMNGIEPGCVVELEYKITTQAGVRPYMAADVRLDHTYPVTKRIIEINTPDGVQPTSLVTGVDNPTPESSPGTQRWTFNNLPGAVSESQAPPWRVGGARLAFSTVGPVGDWLRLRHGQLATAADESELITKLATEWTADTTSASDKLRALQDKLHARFNFVEFPVEWRPSTIRPASDLIQCNYGLPAEAAALLLSLAWAADLPATAGILVNDETWSDHAPQNGMVAEYVVLLTAETGQPEIWSAQRGRITRDGHWAGYHLLPIPAVPLPPVALRPWTDASASTCALDGQLTIADDGTCAGRINLRLSGLFVSPEGLRDKSAQESRLAGLIKRVVPGLEVTGFSVTSLSGSTFEAQVDVKSKKPLDKLDGRYRLMLAQNGPFMANVSLPLNHATRTLPVRLAGAFDERIDLTIDWPEGWSVEVHPAPVDNVAGNWGHVRQQVTADGDSVRIERNVQVVRNELSAGELLELRAPLNELRSEQARMIVLNP